MPHRALQRAGDVHQRYLATEGGLAIISAAGSFGLFGDRALETL
jgi:hypothetical protein